MFFTSPRNSIPAHIHLFNCLGCQTMLTSSPVPPVVNAIAGAHPLKVLEIPSVHDLLHKKYPQYPYNKTFEEAKDEPLLALHTSGTTGIPKPLVWTHGWAAGFQMWSQMDPPEGFESRDRYYQGNRLFPLLPAFHVSIVLNFTTDAVLSQCLFIVLLSHVLILFRPAVHMPLFSPLCSIKHRSYSHCLGLFHPLMA